MPGTKGSRREGGASRGCHSSLNQRPQPCWGVVRLVKVRSPNKRIGLQILILPIPMSEPTKWKLEDAEPVTLLAERLPVSTSLPRRTNECE